MKSIERSIAVLALGLAAAGAAWADGGYRHHHHGPRVQFGIVVGPPVVYWEPWYPRYYYPPYYPPVVIERSAPPVYIEQAPAAQAAPTGYWYYCGDAKGYYPYVKECPGGWLKVVPQPPKQP